MRCLVLISFLAMLVGCSNADRPGLIQPEAPPTPSDTGVSPGDTSPSDAAAVSDAADAGVVDSGCPSSPCGDGESVCACECVELASSLEHCGECDTPCGEDQICEGGTCLMPCPEGLTRCDEDEECVDLLSDFRACGECDNRCPVGQICHEGVCGDPCDPHEQWCGEACVDVQVSSDNCGECGLQCDTESDVCREGECVFRCLEGEVLCNGVCADLQRNSHHCSACFNRCSVAQDCVEAECVTACPVTHTRCGENICADLTRHNAHCGGCGQACSDHLVCRQASCTCEDPLLQNCGDACVDVMTTNEHCGACGIACPVDQVCSEGQCTCAIPGFAVCDGVCLNVLEDENNCGECDNVCEDGIECSFGFCGVRPEIMLCGNCSRDINQYLPEGLSLVRGCAPNERTQAMLITRNGAAQLNAEVARSYVAEGGILITEYNISDEVFTRVFAQVNQGVRQGSCTDRIATVSQHTPDDPFWRDNEFVPMIANQTGCGHDVSNFPDIVPLAGWSANTVALAYRELELGRLWLVEADWQDNQAGDFQQTWDYMAYMMMHR